jgi:thioesterase domain-containing protein/acyl carrier protein
MAIDWDALHGPGRRRRVPLPTYPFQRRRCWLEALDEFRPARPAAAVVRTAALPRSPGCTATRQEVEPRLAELWRELLGVDRLQSDDDFFDLGGDSLHAIDLGARLKSELGIELSSDFLLETPTLGGMAELVATALARAAAGGTAPSRSSCLVEMQSGNGGGRRPFFLVHPVGGHVYFYRDVAAALGEDQPVYGLRARGLEEGEEPHGSIEQMAAHYVEAVQSFQPAGPYLLGGSSMGGMVAFEIAQQLRAQGREVAVLALMDTPGPSQMPARPADPAELLFLLYGNWQPISLDELRRRGEEERVAYLLNAAQSVEGFPRNFSHDNARRHLEVVAALWQTMFDYRPRPYPGSLLFFRAKDRGTIGFSHPEQAWIDLAENGAEVHVVPGDHTSMHRPPHLEILAGRLRTALDRAQALVVNGSGVAPRREAR